MLIHKLTLKQPTLFIIDALMNADVKVPSHTVQHGWSIEVLQLLLNLFHECIIRSTCCYFGVLIAPTVCEIDTLMTV